MMLLLQPHSQEHFQCEGDVLVEQNQLRPYRIGHIASAFSHEILIVSSSWKATTCRLPLSTPPSLSRVK
jgi:hypothetical protein